MKRLITFILLCSLFSAGLFAQTPRVIKISIVDIVSPKQFDTLTRDGKDEKVLFRIVNHGPDTLKPYDCILTTTSLLGQIYQNGFLCPTRTALPKDTITVETFIRKIHVWGFDTLTISVFVSTVSTAKTDDPILRDGQMYSYALRTIYYNNNIQPGFAPLSNEDLKIYPNPVSSKLSVLDLHGEVNFELVDVSGRQILNGKANCDGVLQIDVSEIPAGVYIIKATSDGRFLTGKFVKNTS
jgi:hypothetical protein